MDVPMRPLQSCFVAFANHFILPEALLLLASVSALVSDQLGWLSEALLAFIAWTPLLDRQPSH
jgi:hypothetical protein